MAEKKNQRRLTLAQEVARRGIIIDFTGGNMIYDEVHITKDCIELCIAMVEVTDWKDAERLWRGAI